MAKKKPAEENKGGRPLKFKTVKELQEIDFDCNVNISNWKTIKTDDFEKEKDLVSFILDNMNKFCTEALEDDLKTFAIDLPITKSARFGPRGKRVDIYIECEKNNYIIETKNPKNLMENRQGIGQLLDYGREFSDTKKAKLILLTTRFDLSTALTIAHYNLPIRYIYFEKARMLEYEKKA